MSAAEALRWVAIKLDAEAETLRQDWVSVLVRSNTRARIETLSEVAVACRAAAVRASSGGGRSDL